MNKMFSRIKFISVVLFISTYLLITLPFLLTIKKFPTITRKVLAKIVSFYSKGILFILRVKVVVKGEIKKGEGYFTVSNHMSYLDILSISSCMPTLYVTSLEMKRTPLLGQITTLAGCLFVERRSRSNILNEINEIKETLESGINVTVFPEATSSSGEVLLPFKRSLFEAAAKSEKKILPLTLNYNEINRQKVTTSNRDYLCWYGKMDFLSHLISLCEQSSAHITIHISSEILTENESDTVVLRDRAFEVINQNFEPFTI